jgi:hypothetical protein
MKKHIIQILIILTLGASTVIISGCDALTSNNTIIDISFQMNEREDYPRSDQLVIWLEKPDGTFVKTLFISEYLSYGGYKEADICPDWSSNTNWEKVSQEEFDALTGATPSIGPVQMKIKLSKTHVPEGEYIIFIEVHLTADYNELYSGKINVSSEEETSTLLKVSYIPKKYPDASYNILSNVRINIH